MHKNLPDYGNLNSDTVEKRKCPGIVTSLHIELLHASIGTFANPQTKIIGVVYKFGKLTDVKFTCSGIACNYRYEQSVEKNKMYQKRILLSSGMAGQMAMSWPMLMAG